MAEGYEARGSVVSVERLRAEVSEKRAETESMKKELNEMKAKLEEIESECARIREENKQAIELYAQFQLYVDNAALAFLDDDGSGGDA